MAELIEKLPQLILTAVDANPMLGYGAIALVMLLENVIPPIPSEVVMPLAGFLIQQGRLQLVPVVLAGLLSCVFLAIPAAGTVYCKCTQNITTQPRGIILIDSCYLSVSSIAS